MSMSSKCFSSALTGPGVGTPGTAATGGTVGTGVTPENGGTPGTGETTVTGGMTGGSTGWCSYIISSYSLTRETEELALSCSEVIMF